MDDGHFLERLERVGWRETELALRLYREPALVRLLLDDARAPEAPRIAIALAAGEAPPHVIVARDGGFVTCLGGEMGVGDHPVVPFASIERAADRHEALKGRLAYIDWAVENAGDIRRIWRSIYRDAHRVPREAIDVLTPLVGIFSRSLFASATVEDHRAQRLVFDNTNRFAADRRLTSRDTDALEAIWRHHWATAHLLGLIGIDPQLLRAAGRALEPGVADAYLHGFGAMRFGFQPTSVRGAWLAARIGADALRRAKVALDGSMTPLFTLVAAMSIAFVGAAHRGLRAEAAKALSLGARTPERFPDEHFRAFMARALDPSVLPPADQVSNLVTAYARECLKAIGADDAEPEPEELAVAAWKLVDNRTNVFRYPKEMMRFGIALPWFARAELADFYPAERWLPEIPAWEPGDSLQLIRDTLHIGAFVNAPVARAPKIGRNAPCPCDSGKKYKRCCGA
ncbi:MAG: SEC-C domain-containing protein [Deltaproteobacteria bacterium]|nr:SEC-C domain-containing protein [Deltaproteobacteria bacterium]